MPDVFFTKDHEYLRLDGDTGIVGITDYAQSQLGDVVFVELPALGTKVKQGEKAAVVESVKAASEIFAPVSGEVTGINDAIESTPGTVNEDSEGAGWFLKIKVADRGELASLMDEPAYRQFLKTIG